MAQVVEPDPRELAALDGAVEELAERFGVQEPAGGVAEHPFVGPTRQPFACELSSPPSKLVECGAVDLDCSSAGSGLDAELDGRPPTFWSVRDTDSREWATLRSHHLRPTISPRRMPVWAARCNAG